MSSNLSAPVGRFVDVTESYSDSAELYENALFHATHRLLIDDAWRQRVVEQITPLTADHYQIQRSFQLEIPYEMEGLDPDVGPVPLVLPVCWIAKRPMLDFDITDESGASVAVMPRREIAGVVGRSLESSSLLVSESLPLETFVAIAASSLGTWEQMTQLSTRPAEDVLIDYTKNGTGISVRPADSHRLLNEGRRIASDAYDAAGLAGIWQDLYPDNPAFSGLLLASYANPDIQDRDSLVEWVDSHHHAIDQLIADTSESEVNRSNLRRLCIAGVRWPVLIRRACHFGEVVLIKTQEVRPSGHPRVRRFQHEAHTDAAQSFHIQIHSPDPTVVIRGDVEAFSAFGAEVGFPQTFEAFRQTDELFTAYLGHPDRPDTVRFEIRFGLRAHVWLGYLFALVLAASALLGLLLSENLEPELAGVLAIPTSLVAAFVVVREPPLTARYLDWQRWTLIGLSVLVWVVVVWRLVWVPLQGT